MKSTAQTKAFCIAKMTSRSTLILTALSLLIVSISASTASADSESTGSRRLRGTVALWKKTVCADEMACSSLPQPMGVAWAIDDLYEIPRSPGPVLAYDRVAQQGDWKVRIQQIWVRPAGRIPYVVTQTRLTHAAWGTIAECTRYDGIDAFESLPPGSCGARVGGEFFGVSFAGP